MMIRSFTIEITRRCHCDCLHCMRGDAQDLDLKISHLKKMIEKLEVKAIDRITITGGEPFLAVRKMQEVLNYLKLKEITIGSFYIVTSASFKIEYAHLNFLTDIYSYCEEKRECELSLSDNIYTKQRMLDDTVLKLSAFKFTIPRSLDADFREGYMGNYLKKPGYDINNGLIMLGNAVVNYDEIQNYSPVRAKPYYPDDKIEILGEEIEELYLSAKGDILTDCDYCYEAEEDFKVCHVNDVKSLKKFKKMEKVECTE